MPAKQEVLRQIDAALALHDEHRARAKYDNLSDLHDAALTVEIKTVVAAALERLAPAGSPYRATIDGMLTHRVGALRALRRDYDAGYLVTIQGLVRAEVFVDFIEMAEHLLAQGYKDPAAVLVGSVLEEHLRALCATRNIPVQSVGKLKKADTLNAELAACSAYNKLDQKNITAWLDLRNKAAHGHYAEYTAEQVATMLTGVQEFMTRLAV